MPKALACAAAFLVVFFPQLLVWRLMWGRWGQMVMNNPSETFHWSHPVLLQLLFSTRHGLFYWSPVMLPALCGFAALLATRRPRTVLLSAATLLLALYYVYASWAIWWMGYSFGARGFIALSTLFALGLGWLFQRFARHAWLLALLSAALILWNQAMIALFLTARIPRTEAFAPLLPFQKLLELASGLLGRLFH